LPEIFFLKKTNFIAFALKSNSIVSIFVPLAGNQKYELFSMPVYVLPVKISKL